MHIVGYGGLPLVEYAQVAVVRSEDLDHMPTLRYGIRKHRFCSASKEESGILGMRRNGGKWRWRWIPPHPHLLQQCSSDGNHHVHQLRHQLRMQAPLHASDKQSPVTMIDCPPRVTPFSHQTLFPGISSSSLLHAPFFSSHLIPVEIGGFVRSHHRILKKMAADLRGWWRQKREDLALQHQEEPAKLPFMIPSPVEDKDTQLSIAEEKAARAKQCTDEGFKAGLKAALWACAFSTIPTLAAVRFVPWAKANINYTGQALIISSATISTYFVVTEQTMLECSRKGNVIAIEKSRAGATS